MKILVVNKFFYAQGGSETYMFQLSALLRSAGHQVVEFSMADPKNESSADSRYFVKHLDFNKSEGLIKDFLKACHLLYSCEAKKKLEQLIQKEKPDLAHLHNFNFQLTPSILGVLKKYNIPAVWTLHDYKAICPNYRLFTQGEVCERCRFHKYYNCFTHKCLKNSWGMSFLAMLEMYLHKIILRSYDSISCLISPSKFLAAKVVAWKLPKDKVKQLYYALDLAKFEPGEALGQGLVYVGRLVEEKGILTLIEALKELPDLNLQIIGAGPQKPEIEQMISSYGLTNVKLLGHKSGRDLRDLISKSKLVIVPSVWYENNPYSILEAFALAKPVIGSDLGGIPELVKNNKTGFLFKAGDSADLADKIKNCYYNDELVKSMGSNCREWVEQNCEPNNHLDEILRIYKEVLK